MLPVDPSTLARNFAAGQNQVRQIKSDQGMGTGGGETLLKYDDDSGEAFYGQDQIPLNLPHKFVVPLNGFRYGYIVWEDGKPIERHMVDLSQVSAENPIPIPPGGVEEFVRFDDGPNKSAELVLNSVEEPGFSVVLPCNPSAQNQMDKLAAETGQHQNTPAANAGYRSPVISVKAMKYYSKKKRGDVWHFGYDLVDWLHDDGKRFLSQNGVAELAAASPKAAAAIEDDELFT